MHELARRGVRANWEALTPSGFLEEYLWCVGSVQKTYTAHLRHFPRQKQLFRDCDPVRIAQEADQVRAEWQASKCNLNNKMVEAVIETAKDIASGWDRFKASYLKLPRTPRRKRWPRGGGPTRRWIACRWLGTLWPGI